MIREKVEKYNFDTRRHIRVITPADHNARE